MNEPNRVHRQPDCETDNRGGIYVYVDKPADLTVRPMRPELPRDPFAVPPPGEDDETGELRKDAEPKAKS